MAVLPSTPLHSIKKYLFFLENITTVKQICSLIACHKAIHRKSSPRKFIV